MTVARLGRCGSARWRVAAAASLVAVALPALAIVSGSGVAKTETRAPGAFSRIETSGAVALEVTAGQSSAIVLVSGDDNVVPLVKTTVAGDTLKVRVDEGMSTRLPLVVKVAVPRLATLTVSGATRVSVANLAGPRFELKGSGATKVSLGGAVDELAIDVSGASRVDAVALTARKAGVIASGAAVIDVNATEKLDARLSGAAKLGYLGNPAITKSLSGAGRVERRK